MEIASLPLSQLMDIAAIQIEGLQCKALVKFGVSATPGARRARPLGLLAGEFPVAGEFRQPQGLARTSGGGVGQKLRLFE